MVQVLRNIIQIEFKTELKGRQQLKSTSNISLLRKQDLLQQGIHLKKMALALVHKTEEANAGKDPTDVFMCNSRP